MFTFSEMVDAAAARSNRPDRIVDIAAFLNQTVRDLHTTATNQPVLYSKNLVEDQLIADIATGYSWQLPSNTQMFLTARYSSVQTPKFLDGVYPVPMKPGRAMNNEDYYYYMAGGFVYFKGYGGVGGTIDLAYYTYPKRLVYYAIVAERPATYDLATETWEYLTAVTDDEKVIARALVTNWLLTDWYDVCLEGTLAKLFKILGDEKRAITAYALYQQQRTQLWGTESIDSAGI